MRGDLLVFFNIHSAAKLQKKGRRNLFRKLFCLKEVALCRNNEKKVEKKFYRYFFRIFFEVSGKSHSAKKCKKGDPLGSFKRPF